MIYEIIWQYFNVIRGVACDVRDLENANGGFHCFISSPHPIACRLDLHNTTNDHSKLLLIKGGHLTYPHMPPLPWPWDDLKWSSYTSEYPCDCPCICGDKFLGGRAIQRECCLDGRGSTRCSMLSSVASVALSTSISSSSGSFSGLGGMTLKSPSVSMISSGGRCSKGLRSTAGVTIFGVWRKWRLRSVTLLLPSTHTGTVCYHTSPQPFLFLSINVGSNHPGSGCARNHDM